MLRLNISFASFPAISSINLEHVFVGSDDLFGFLLSVPASSRQISQPPSKDHLSHALHVPLCHPLLQVVHHSRAGIPGCPEAVHKVAGNVPHRTKMEFHLSENYLGLLLYVALVPVLTMFYSNASVTSSFLSIFCWQFFLSLFHFSPLRFPSPSDMCFSLR